MSIQKEHYINGFKLPHNVIKKMSAARIKNHLKFLRQRRRNYFCDCCATPYYELYDSCANEKEELQVLEKYIKFIQKEFYSRSNALDYLDSLANKYVDKSNKGCQTKTHSKRKKERRDEEKHMEFCLAYDSRKKAMKHSIRKKIK